MRLTFGSPFLSITSFNEVEVPAFTVVTGPNGIGKTHLLKAIQGGHIRNDVSPTNPGFIQFADNASAVGDASTFQRMTIDQEVGQVYAAFQKLKEHGGAIYGIYNTLASVFNVPNLDRANVEQMFIQVEQVIGALEQPQQGYARQRLAQLQTELSRNYAGAINNLPLALRRMYMASKRLRRPIYEIRIEHVLAEEDFGDVEFLSQSFSRLFLTYHQRLMANKFNQYLATQGEDVAFLSDNEFVEQYQLPPWDLVNDNLRRFNADIEMVKPSGYPLTSFTAYIRDRQTGIVRDYSSLSSGERVFFALFVATYKTIDPRQGTIKPNILLLDEVDATLHPSMVRKFLDMVRHTIVEGMRVHVVLTTHSPTTVALAEEGSVFVMYDGPKRLEKVGKNQAIAELTIGVPFLSLSFDGRRQVFVESPSDAAIYERLYTILRPRLGSERSLQFIPAGTGGEGSGCAAVRRIVEQLVKAGNSTVFGLLDWDGENVQSDRMKVLAYGRRNGLENVLLDPLLIACLIVREIRIHLADLRLEAAFTWRALVEAQFAQAPELAAIVEHLVLGDEPDSEKVECVYEGGMVLQLRRSYLEKDDHELESAIKERFASLKAVRGVGPTRNAGALSYKIVESVLIEYPELIPREIVDVFGEILDA